MRALERLGPEDLAGVMTAYRDALRLHQAAIDSLNVFPVPDGDTGTNMALTMESVIEELARSAGGAASMSEVCDAVAHGSLMGARGNSGVVLCQILRGLVSTFSEAESVGTEAVVVGLERASEAAYRAVMRPVEGTILTVARGAAEGARKVSWTASMGEVLEGAKAAAAEQLRRTPDLLPVLAEAGVVDAGGTGYLLLLDALLHVTEGRELPVPPEPAAARVRLGAGAPPPDGDGVGDLRYEVMYLLHAPDDAMEGFKEVWAGIGDSIVVVGGGGLWNCHIHTDDIGAALEAALDVGRPTQVRVTDLAEQVEEERWVRESAAQDGGGGPSEPLAQVTTAVVAVATGEGLRRIFRSLGVPHIVAGGQSMNPSTAQILEAVEAAPASEVVVLPNNDNIYAVAEQVDGLTEKVVRVVRTRDVASGFAALLEYDPASGADDNAAAMSVAASRVLSGEVTRAVRAHDSAAGPIAAGDWIGLASGKIKAVSAESCAAAACDLLDQLLDDAHEIVTLIEGEGATVADTRRITSWVGERRPDVAVEVHHGGQPLYPYLLSVE